MRGVIWLAGEPLALTAPSAIHLVRAAPSAVLVAGATRIPGAALLAGWLPLPAGARRIWAEGAPIPLARGADGGPALRSHADPEGAIPEHAWSTARVWGAGAVVAVGNGRARPVLRLEAGTAAWVTLPPLDLPALPAPRLVALRGPLPRASLRWGLPHAPVAGGPAPITLALRAGLASEVVWAG
jgi:hypothetical protein